MPWNGAGIFERLFSWVADDQANINITASRMDADTDDIVGNGLDNCLTRDGQGQPTSNLPMNGFRHTGVAIGIARNDYATLGQVQDLTISYAPLTGTDTYVGTLVPVITAYATGADYGILIANPNLTTTPTINLNTIGAITVLRADGSAIVPGDLNGEHLIRFDGTNFRLLNPAMGSGKWVVSAGFPDAITANYSPAIITLYDGLLLGFRASAANATATPTFAPNATTAHVITKKGGAALSIGDIPGNLAECLVRYNLANTRWELLNPVGGIAQLAIQSFAANGTYTPTVGMKFCLVKGTGAGGGGTDGVSNGSNGGNTILGSPALVTFNGGLGATTSSQGVGGTTTATSSIQGASGQPGYTIALLAGAPFGGNGANGPWGGGGWSSINNGGNSQAAASAPGAGGAGSCNGASAGSGGGAGGYGEQVFTAAQIGASQAVVIGAAGAAGGSSGAGFRGQLEIIEYG